MQPIEKIRNFEITFVGHVLIFVVSVEDWSVRFVRIIVDLNVDRNCDRYWQIVGPMILGRWRRRSIILLLVLIIIVRFELHVVVVIVWRSRAMNRSVVRAAVATQADAKS